MERIINLKVYYPRGRPVFSRFGMVLVFLFGKTRGVIVMVKQSHGCLFSNAKL